MTIAMDSLAFDRGSVRSYDRDGRLRVEMANISKANVCPYLGEEIPGWQALGLQADRIYQMLRDPEELERAAPSSNGVQLLEVHKAVHAKDPQTKHIVGAVGTNAKFSDPYLQNALIVWDANAIKLIESDEKKELSGGYHYRPDMTPGTFKGVHYDGVMRDIEFNHVAIVVEGRAGADVVVGDSKEKLSMTKPVLTRKAAMVQGAVLALVRPKLATDAKIDLTAALKGVTSKNYDAMKGVIVTGINAAVKGKLAQDADIGDLAELLDALAPVDAGDEDPDDKDADAVPLKNEGEDDADTPLKAHLKGKLSDDDYAKACDLMGGKAKDAEPEPEPKESKESKEPKAKDKGAKDAEKKEDDDKVSKAAMDSAISAAVTAAVRTAKVEAARAQREIRDAEAMVQPYVGRLSMAHDSAEGVLRTALTMLGVSDVAAIHASALPAVLKAQPVPGAAPKRAPIAQDAKAAKGFADRYPDAVQVRSL